MADMQTKNPYIKQIQMGSVVYDVYDMDAHTLIEGLQTAVTGGVHFCGILKGTYGTDVLENNREVGLLDKNLQTQDKDQSGVALVHGTGTSGTWATGDMIIDKNGIEYINSHYSVTLEYEHMKCEYSSINEQCIKERCPYYDCKRLCFFL